MTTNTLEILLLSDSRDWIDELCRLSADDAPRIHWSASSEHPAVSADWGITAAAPDAVREYAEKTSPYALRRYDLQEALNSFEKYEVIVSLHARQIFSAELVQQKVCVNLHPGLPHQRGWVPYSWAIMAGETHTGCTLHRMEDRIDRGYVFDQASVPISATDTAGTLRERIMEAERGLFATWIPHRISELLQPADVVGNEEFPLRTQSEWNDVCQLNPSDLDVIRKLRAMTFSADHSEAWYEDEGNRYRVAVRVFKDEA